MGNEGAVNKISSFLVRGQCPYKPPVEYSVDRITYIHVRTHKASYTHTHTHTHGSYQVYFRIGLWQDNQSINSQLLPNVVVIHSGSNYTVSGAANRSF